MTTIPQILTDHLQEQIPNLILQPIDLLVEQPNNQPNPHVYNILKITNKSFKFVGTLHQQNHHTIQIVPHQHYQLPKRNPTTHDLHHPNSTQQITHELQQLTKPQPNDW